VSSGYRESYSGQQAAYALETHTSPTDAVDGEKLMMINIVCFRTTFTKDITEKQECNKEVSCKTLARIPKYRRWQQYQSIQRGRWQDLPKNGVPRGIQGEMDVAEASKKLLV